MLQSKTTSSIPVFLPFPTDAFIIPSHPTVTGEPAHTCLNVIINSVAEDMSTAAVAQIHDDEIKSS